jgi:hypothetical protein
MRKRLGFQVLTAVTINSRVAVRSLPTFRRKVIPPFSWSNSKPSTPLATCFLLVIMLACLLLNPEVRGSKFLRNVGDLLAD